ncbi:MAG: hypothetical protein NT036_02895, partial [Candidatus Omnitrophica bacterium]|nr:hypothetical protein [Candidatus Omnitrophota bacterium]
AKAITAAIDAAQAKYKLSDEETKILWLALTGPGQGGGSTTPTFEPLEPRQLLSSTETVSNLLPQYISAPAAIVVNVINTYTDAISGDTININSSTKMATITNNEGRVIHFNGIIIIDPSIITTRSQTYPRVASYVDQAGRKWNVYGNLLDLVNGKDAVYGATINIDTKRNGTLVFPGQVQETFKTIIVRDPASTSKLPSSPYITSINIGGTAFKLYGTFYSFMNAGYSASRNTTSITISNRVDILDKVTIAASPKGSLVGEINMTSGKLYYVLNNKGTISVWSFDLKPGSLLKTVKPVMLAITPGSQILGVHFPSLGQAIADVTVESGSVVRVNLIDAEKSAPDVPSIVTVTQGDRRLFVQDRLADGTLGAPYAYTAQGVNWSPASIGTIPANLTAEFIKWYQTDIPLMARMGINTVRVYHDFGTGPDAFKILNTFYSYGIKVIMEVDSPRNGVVADMGNISAVVNAYMDNPAILMWSIGNEWDTNNYYGHFSTIYDSARFTQDAALLIKSIDVNHPVMTVTNDPHYPGVHPLSPEAFPFETGRPYMSEIVNDLVPAVDVWALNIYRGSTLGDLFEQWRSISDKPMLIGEFGADSYDHRVRTENQAMQAGMNTSIWDEAYFNMSATRISGVSVGVLSFEWNDEWWKAGVSSRHNTSLSLNYGQPDLFNDEEWFGLVDINRKPKAAFYELRDRFKNGVNAVELDASPTVSVVSQGLLGAEFDINDKVFYTRSGGQYGGRGINIAVLDKYTGIRMEDVRAFDTWLPFGGPHQGHQELIDYINSLPDGSIISLAVEDEAGLVSPSGTPWFDTENLYRTLEGLGSTMIRNVQYQGGWAMIAIKGQGVLAENYSSPGAPVYIQAELSLSLDPNHDLRPAQINAISSAVTQELAAREDISFTELFALVRSSVPDTMVNLRNALEDVKPLSEQINVDSKTISAAIEAAQIKYSLSDEETKILWLALLGPGQGGGEQQVPEAAARATEKLFELVENAHKYDGATATVTQAEAHSIIGSIIVLARNAKREEKKLFIGLETEWIPGINEETGYGSQRDAINILLTEIKSIGDTLRSLGLDNVEVVEGNSQGLAGTLLKKAGSNLSNVVVLASAGTINSSSFAELRSTPEEKRAFLAGVDPSEIMEHYKDHKKDMQLAGQQLEIRIMEMLSIALGLAVGKMPPKIPMIFSYDETLRIVIFMPKPEIFNYETLKDANKGRARALQAA